MRLTCLIKKHFSKLIIRSTIWQRRMGKWCTCIFKSGLQRLVDKTLAKLSWSESRLITRRFALRYLYKIIKDSFPLLSCEMCAKRRKWHWHKTRAFWVCLSFKRAKAIKWNGKFCLLLVRQWMAQFLYYYEVKRKSPKRRSFRPFYCNKRKIN